MAEHGIGMAHAVSLPRRREPSPDKLDARLRGHDGAHDFVIVIPVADRPQQLADCLASLRVLRQTYVYPGQVSVLVAEDSLDPDSAAAHRALAQSCTEQGVPAHYLSQDDQRALVEALPDITRRDLAGLLGEGASYARKGASITRNIAYLWLNRLPDDGGKCLFWFIDSDQEFRVVTPDGGDAILDYFNSLDAIFTRTGTQVLTGKVVGDPPVSPAVMAGTFVDDVIGFLSEMAELPVAVPCSFHGRPVRQASDASYHDMADLFGFKTAANPFRFRCPRQGEHDHGDCFAEFAGRLTRFFDGEHPTRRSHYQPDDLMAGIKPARTIYTGNYVFTAQGLNWFIPFAALKLRMAGPTLGRIIQAEIGPAFVTANLPMLHKRTVAETGLSECRPGIERGHEQVDLSGEFERQYFGDVMLFSMETLVEHGFPASQPDAAALDHAVDEVEARMRVRYRATQAETLAKVDRLEALFNDAAQWWWPDGWLAGARNDVARFIADLRRNFAADAPAWRQIDAPDLSAARKAAICAAIRRYRDDRLLWHAILQDARP